MPDTTQFPLVFMRLKSLLEPYAPALVVAADTAEAMEARAFKVDEVDNDPEKATVSGTAEVRYVGKSEVNARWVAAQVAGATVVKVAAQGHPGAKVDLVIGEQFDALASTAEATTAFAASAPGSNLHSRCERAVNHWRESTNP